MLRFTFLEKLKYRFENSLSKGSLSVMYWLAGMIFLVLVVSTSIIILFENLYGGEEQMTFSQAFYEGFYQLLSPGVIDWETASHFRWLMAVLCLVGLLIVSILIGLVSSTIESKIETLRRGRSRIVEQNHVAIFGWNPKIFLIIQELILANINKPKFTIAVMAELDKVDMETEIREKVEVKNANLVVRSGTPTDIDDIAILNPDQAKSIIVLPTDDDDSDMHSVKTLMALINNPKRENKNYHVIMEINSDSKTKVGKIVGGNEVSILKTKDLISRIMVQTCRQPGLSAVYNELLSFEGSEIYFIKCAELAGKTFKEALLYFQKASTIGIRDAKGNTYLNPSQDHKIEAQDDIIVIAEDDTPDTSDRSLATVSEKGLVRTKTPFTFPKDRTLLIGWNNKATIILEELNKYVAAGSELWVVSNFEETKTEVENFIPRLQQLNVTFRQGDTTEESFLQEIKAETFDHVIVLNYSNLESKHADSWTLITLIQLRSIAQSKGAQFNIVSEMSDIRNKALAELARPDDFIISDNITSLILSQLSENPNLKMVYLDLFSADGSEIYLKPMESYVTIGQETNFASLVFSAMEKGEVAIGFRKMASANDPDRNFGITINPLKTDTNTFEKGDMLIVISTL